MGRNMILLIFLLAFFAQVGNCQSAIFLYDTFTAESNASLDAHSPEVGGAWVEHTASQGTVYTGGFLKDTVSAGNAIHYNSASPLDADYVVTVEAALNSTSATVAVGPCVRVQPNLSGYCAAIGGDGSFYLTERASGGGYAQTVGNTTVSGYSSTKTYTVAITAIGSSIAASVYDGASLVATASGADPTISSDGSAGIIMANTFSNVFAISADDSVAQTVTHTVSASELWDNGYDNVANPRQSPFSRFKFSTDANSITVSGTTSLYSNYSAGSHLGMKINGVNQPPLVFTTDGSQNFIVSLGTGTKIVEIIAGAQSIPGSSVIGSFIDSVSYPEDSTFSVLGPAINNRVLVYGDSISVGGNSSNPEYLGYAPMLRGTYGINSMVEGWGYRSLYADANTPALLDGLSARLNSYSPSTIWIAIGTNDYGLNKWSSGSFGSAYGTLIDTLHSSNPSARIICQSPIVRSSENANSFGDTLDEYREQIHTLCSARAWLRCVNGKNILSTGDLADGVHPTTAGHAKYAAYIYGYLNVVPESLLMAQ